MKKGQHRRLVNDRLTAMGGVCAFEGCKSKRYSKYHSYCREHRRLIARQSQYRRYHSSHPAPRVADKDVS
jgi:hypothetical protein